MLNNVPNRLARLASALTLALVGLSAAGPTAKAQTWSLYNGTTSFFVPYASGSMSSTNSATIWLSLNGGQATQFVMDTGSSGIIATAQNAQGQTVFPTVGPSLGAGMQYYSSSGRTTAAAAGRLTASSTPPMSASGAAPPPR